MLKGTKKHKNILLTLDFISPIIAYIIMLIIIWIFCFENYGKIIGLILSYTFPPLGRESIIPLSETYGINPYLMGLCLVLIDVCFAVFVKSNMQIIKNIPIIGKFISRAERKGKKNFKRYKIYTVFSFTILCIFVMLPFQGSGGIIGSIVGKCMSLSNRLIVIAVLVGSFAGCFLIAYFSRIIHKIIPSQYVKTFVFIFISIIILYNITDWIIAFFRKK